MTILTRRGLLRRSLLAGGTMVTALAAFGGLPELRAQ